MPRVTGTRKKRAAELLALAARGPDLGLSFIEAGLTEGQEKLVLAELKKRYELWSKTWLLPELNDLVPELRKSALEAKKGSGQCQ